jgi:hypothetical protein
MERGEGNARHGGDDIESVLSRSPASVSNFFFMLPLLLLHCYGYDQATTRKRLNHLYQRYKPSTKHLHDARPTINRK